MLIIIPNFTNEVTEAKRTCETSLKMESGGQKEEPLCPTAPGSPLQTQKEEMSLPSQKKKSVFTTPAGGNKIFPSP